MTGITDLKLLKSFLTVAESGSISTAANRLNIAQPALSRHIRLLEEALGATLFVRHSRGIVITAAGELLKTRASSLLQDARTLAEEIANAGGDVAGEVTFGLIPSVIHGLSGHIIQRYREKHPRVKLIIEQAYSGTLLELTEQNRINLSVIYEPQKSRNIDYQQLLEEQLYLVGPGNSTHASNRYASLRQALRLPMILPGASHGLRITVEAAASSQSLETSVDIETNSLPLQLDLVRRGIGHTILPLATVIDLVTRGELTACPIRSPVLTRRLVLASPANKPASEATRHLKLLITEEVNHQINSGLWPGIVDK